MIAIVSLITFNHSPLKCFKCRHNASHQYTIHVCLLMSVEYQLLLISKHFTSQPSDRHTCTCLITQYLIININILRVLVITKQEARKGIIQHGVPIRANVCHTCVCVCVRNVMVMAHTLLLHCVPNTNESFGTELIELCFKIGKAALGNKFLLHW